MNSKIKINLFSLRVITACVLLMLSVNLSGQWYWQNPIPTGAGYGDLSFVDENTGWAVGSDGTIIHTNDGGATWSIQYFDPTYVFFGVHFVNHFDGWICGMDLTNGLGVIFATNDGGTTWTKQNCSSNFPFYSVEFIDSNIGWAGGGDLFYTEDAGNTWTKVLSYVSTHIIQDICFVSQDNGWICGTVGYILYTDDGGANWTQIPSGTIDDFLALDFVDNQNGWFVGENGIVLKTSDGGQNFIYQNSTITDNLNGVSFTDSNRGWSVGNNGTIIATEINSQTNE